MSTREEHNGREAVKIVIINTEYIETDAKSFKSVVQKLTGRNSSPAPAEPTPATSHGPKIRRQSDHDLPPLEELLRLYADEIRY
ncbi:hypothetical protein RND71_034772 [Anisodus tanguticus]|uniref:VQ domain-containing protein n=1 Tax=Anisodus tanguticus TaxID=243964 RepID=A0AAE1R3T4_9SOLA|nr:hypothetical protein RND71_034772 [Anisodus tanguticus]